MKTALFRAGEFLPSSRILIEHSGQRAEVMATREYRTGNMHTVRFEDGHEDSVYDEELSDWREDTK